MMELRESGRNPEIANGVGGSGEQDFVTLDDCVNYWLKHFVPTLKKGDTSTRTRYGDIRRRVIPRARPQHPNQHCSSKPIYIRRIRESLPLEHWRTHDFRRSLSTGASELGVMPHVVEKMLGHELGGVLAVYNKHDWLDDQLKAYELYADKLTDFLGSNDG